VNKHFAAALKEQGWTGAVMNVNKKHGTKGTPVMDIGVVPSLRQAVAGGMNRRKQIVKEAMRFGQLIMEN
jgi:hypothetical protein